MKKSVSLIITIAFLLALCGCGFSFEVESITDIAAAEETAAPEIISEPDNTPLPSPEPVPVPVPEPTPAPTPRPLMEPQLSDRSIDASLFEPAAEKGEVITIHYETRDYMYGPEDVYGKDMNVYLPFGYSEEQQYDVLFLAHIASQDENWWLNSVHMYDDPDAGLLEVSIPTLLDNMIERGMCRPLIVIALNCYVHESASWQHDSARDYGQFPIEFRDDIMPAVKENLSVYDAREHYGFLGASYGAYVDYLCVLTECFDLVGWHAQTGGGTVYADYLNSRWAAIGAQDMELCGLYLAEGDRDDAAQVMEGIYNMSGHENFSYTIIQGAGHEFREWDVALYNALQIFFR